MRAQLCSCALLVALSAAPAAAQTTVNGSSQSAILNPTVPIEPWRRGDFSALGIAIRTR